MKKIEFRSHEPIQTVGLFKMKKTRFFGCILIDFITYTYNTCEKLSIYDFKQTDGLTYRNTRNKDKFLYNILL